MYSRTTSRAISGRLSVISSAWNTSAHTPGSGGALSQTFLGERYRRLVKRRGKLKALVAVARSILVIVWHLLADPTATFHDLGADYHTRRLDLGKKTRNHVRQLEALGYTVTLEPTAA
jgi:transposase